jgi:hypothetical protein
MKAIRVGAALSLLAASVLVGGPSFAGGLVKLSTAPASPISSLLHSGSKATPNPATRISVGRAFSDCYPVHRIANDFDYCLGIPVLH